MFDCVGVGTPGSDEQISVGFPVLVRPPLFFSVNLSRRDQTMAASNQIDARVTKVLVEALGVEEHDIKPSATLQGDLGAESIDYLDIIFRLEREFMIKIPRGELLAEPLFTGDREIVQDGRVTDEGLALLRHVHALRRLDWFGARPETGQHR